MPIKENGMQKLKFTPSCTPPSQASVSQISASSAVLEWSGANNAQFYFVYYRKAGTQRWAFRRVAGLALELTNLSPCSEYEIQIRSGCAWGFPSREAKEIRFSTLGTAPEIEIKAYRLSPCEVGLKATLGFVSYHWSVDGADSNKVIVTKSGHYNVVGIDSNGCSATASKTVDLNIFPFFCPTPAEEAAVGRAIQNHKPRLIEDLKLCAEALAGVMDNEKVKRQVALLAADTQSIQGVIPNYYRVRLNTLIQSCQREEGINLTRLMNRSLLQNGASAGELLRFSQILNGYTLPGAGRAIFYPSIYFPYLDTAVRGAQTAWDGVSIDYVSVGSLFECAAEYPTYRRNSTTGRVTESSVSRQDLLNARTWKVIMTDNMVGNTLDFYMTNGVLCGCSGCRGCQGICSPHAQNAGCGEYDVINCSCPPHPCFCMKWQLINTLD
jgi:hypothetical protein